jgi:hypothetical protein
MMFLGGRLSVHGHPNSMVVVDKQKENKISSAVESWAGATTLSLASGKDMRDVLADDPSHRTIIGRMIPRRSRLVFLMRNNERV